MRADLIAYHNGKLQKLLAFALTTELVKRSSAVLRDSIMFHRAPEIGDVRRVLPYEWSLNCITVDMMLPFNTVTFVNSFHFQIIYRLILLLRWGKHSLW